jgi:glycosyltransferase involved in cell wall biosynthesis
MEICIVFPTRGRPQKSVETLRKYIEFASDVSRIRVIVSVDDDDTTVNAKSYTDIHPCITVVSAPPKGKIGAINRDVPDPSTWDILLLASDDMIPVTKGYDERIRVEMGTHFPDRDGVLFFNDGYATYKLNTLVICGSTYYKRFGYIYNPVYKSFFCDNEFMDEANILGRQIYIHDVIIKHEHPANNSTIQSDDLYKVNDSDWTHDKDLYFSRKKTTCDLSVLICTIPSRIYLLIALLNRIAKLKQTTTLCIEVLTDDGMAKTIGKKRQDLLDLATGTYCCFIDDDDQITDEYFKVIEESGLRYDCVRLNGVMYTNGVKGLPFYHSLAYSSWFQDEEGYYRTPNHLNAIKTAIAKQIGFTKLNHAEDSEFSNKLYASGLLKSEYTHDTVQYIYMYTKHNKASVETLYVKQRLNRLLKLR